MSKQLRELGADGRFFLPQLLEPRHGAEPRQAAELILIQIRHEYPPTE
jgi:hypothetical protein